jgi:hypothetical protein
MKNAVILCVLALVAAGQGCAVKAYSGAKLPADKVCLFEGGDRMSVLVIDGKSVESSRGLLRSDTAEIETLPGRHAVGYGREGYEAELTLSFTCKAGHRYRLKAGEVNAGLYGSRKLYLVEDAGSKEVVAAQK